MAAGSATDMGLEPGWSPRQPRASLVPVPDNSEKAVISERHAACAITLPKSSMAVRLTTLMYRVTPQWRPNPPLAESLYPSRLLATYPTIRVLTLLAAIALESG